MPVYSMTGYASVMAPAPASDSSHPTSPLWSLEIRSVNSRFLDMGFKLPDEWRHLEPVLRQAVQAACRRGKVEIKLQTQFQDRESNWQPLPQALLQLTQIQHHLQHTFPQAAPLSMAELLHWSSRVHTTPPISEEALIKASQTALAQWLQARASEGEKLTAVLLTCIQQLLVLVEDAKQRVPRQIEQQRQRFLQRWADAMSLVNGDALSDEARERAMLESAAFASRADVAEELARLTAHLTEIRELLKRGGELGKRLDFLIQELHREANTLGSKAASLDMTRISVDMKVLIEQMREQVQNIE